MVFETVRTMLADCLGCDEDRIAEDTVILEDLEASPEDLEEVLLGIEEEYGITCPDNAVRRFVTVEDLVRYIEDQI